MNESKFNVNDIKLSNNLYDLNKEIFTKAFTLKDLGISSRVLKYWSLMGILREENRAVDENHKLNFTEYIWLKIIVELREFGYPIEYIKKAKEILLKKESLAESLKLHTDEALIEFLRGMIKATSNKDIPVSAFLNSPSSWQKYKTVKRSLLDNTLLILLGKKENIDWVFFNEGGAVYVHEDASKNSEQVITYLKNTSHLRIPLMNLVMNFIEDKSKLEYVAKYMLLSPKEMEILKHIRKGDFESITIHLRNNEPIRIDETRKIKIPNTARISEILAKRSYEKIELVTQEGTITYATKTVKTKL